MWDTVFEKAKGYGGTVNRRVYMQKYLSEEFLKKVL